MASFVFTVFSLGFSGKLSMNTRSIEIDEVTECHSQGTVKYQGLKRKILTICSILQMRDSWFSVIRAYAN